jgi:hypothetical protein
VVVGGIYRTLTSKGMRPARAGGLAPVRRHPADVTDTKERRRNHALRRRIDQLLGRVRAAEAEIVERGLSAVHDAPPDADGSGASPPVDAAVAPSDAADKRP